MILNRNILSRKMDTIISKEDVKSYQIECFVISQILLIIYMLERTEKIKFFQEIFLFNNTKTNVQNMDYTQLQ